MDGRIGQYIDDYCLVRHVGSGAFGEVYLGKHVSNQSLVAVKILQLPAENLKGFIKEASTAFRLKHPHIVQLLSFGIGSDDTPYLIMNYAPHGTLRDRHPKGSRLPLDLVLSYALPLASALQYAHDKRVVHRDVKPENVLLGPAGEILLSDFGIAVVAPVGRSFSTHNLGGTAAYMSPEQISGKPQPASDQYALATMIYEWLCGERPFQGNQWEILEQQRSSLPPSLREKHPELPAPIEEAIFKALAKTPQERFASVRDFAHALEGAYRVTFPGTILANTSLKLPELGPVGNFPAAPAHLSEASSQISSLSGPTLRSLNYHLDSADASLTPPPVLPSPSNFAPATSEPARDERSMSVREIPFREQNTSSPFSITDQPLVTPGRPRRGLSRRAVVFTLAGLAGIGVAGSALALRSRLEELPPITPVLHLTTPTPAVGATLYTYHSKNSGYGLAWSPDGQSLASASDASSVQVWHAANGHVIFTYQLPGSPVAIESIAWSPDGKLIAFSNVADSTIDVWDAVTGQHFFTYQGASSLASIAWSPDSTLIASGGSTVDIWKVASGERIYTYPGIAGAGNLTGLAWSPTGKRLTSSYLGNVALVWDATTGEHVLIFSTQQTQGILSVAWSPDGQFIASGHGDATAVVWEAATGRPIYTHTGHSRAVEGVSWSPDGKRIASASDDGTVQLWDSTTGAHVYIYKGHSSFVSRALWSSDGKRIASVGGDNTVQVWIAQ